MLGKITTIVLLLATLSNPQIQVSAQALDRADYYKQFEIFSDYPQFTLEEIEAKIKRIQDQGQVRMVERDIIDLIGPSSQRIQEGQSVFLQYYSMGPDESLILTVQLYLSAQSLIESEETVEGDPINIPQPHLVLFDVQHLSSELFEPLITNEASFESLLEQDVIKDEEVFELLGTGHNYSYDYQANLLRYEWIYITEAEDVYDYLSIEVDHEGEVIKITNPEIIYERKKEPSEENTEGSSIEQWQCQF